MQQTNIDKNQIPENGITIQNIVVRPTVRQAQDIQKWRNALKSAEMIMGRRVLLYDLYDEITLDGVLKNLIAKRILGVTKNELVYINADGEENEVVSKLMKSKKGRELRKEIQKQKAYGISVIELGNDKGNLTVYSVPRKHILPKIGKVVKEQNGIEGYNYREGIMGRTVLEVGKWDDLGYILEACPYVIYKRGGFGDWAQYAQIFGMPFRKATYDGYNEVARMQLEKALEEAGSAPYIVLPEGSSIEFIEQKGAQGSTDLYNSMRKACNEEMAILILGQTQTTVKEQGKLGGNDSTHEQTEDDINLDDREDELAVFNENVKPILINLGFPLDAGGSFIHKPEEEKTDPEEFVTVAATVKNDLKMPIDEDQVYQVTGLNKPSDYAAQKKKMEEQAAAAPQPPQPPVNKPGSGKKQGPEVKKDKQDRKLSRFDEFKLWAADFFVRALKS